MNKPDYRITARHKETKQDVVREYTTRDGETRTAKAAILAGWEQVTRNGHHMVSVSLAPGWELHGPNGEVITTGKEGSYWMSLWDDRSLKAEDQAARQVGDTGRDDDLPF